MYRRYKFLIRVYSIIEIIGYLILFLIVLEYLKGGIR